MSSQSFTHCTCKIGNKTTIFIYHYVKLICNTWVSFARLISLFVSLSHTCTLKHGSVQGLIPCLGHISLDRWRSHLDMARHVFMALLDAGEKKKGTDLRESILQLCSSCGDQSFGLVRNSSERPMGCGEQLIQPWSLLAAPLSLHPMKRRFSLTWKNEFTWKFLSVCFCVVSVLRVTTRKYKQTEGGKKTHLRGEMQTQKKLRGIIEKDGSKEGQEKGKWTYRWTWLQPTFPVFIPSRAVSSLVSQ